MDWDDLRVLLALREKGSMAKAARALRVDQATVGRRIRGLEKNLGVTLIERALSGTALTPAGEEVARSAGEMDASAQALERRLAGASLRVAGTVHVAAPDTIASAIVAPRLAALHALHPELRVELVAGSAAVNLPRREADVALRLFRPAEPTLVARRLCPVAFAVYASARYLATRKLTAAAPLSAHDVIGWHVSLLAAPQGRWFEEATAGAHVPLRTNSAYAMLAAARADVGAALLPCFLGDAERDLRRIVEPSAVSAPELWLVVHEDLRRAARIRAVILALERIIAGAQPLLRGQRTTRSPGR